MITIEFAELSLPIQAKKCFLAIVNNGLKKVLLEATPNMITETIAECIIRRYITVNGVPCIIKSDKWSECLQIDIPQWPFDA